MATPQLAAYPYYVLSNSTTIIQLVQTLKSMVLTEHKLNTFEEEETSTGMCRPAVNCSFNTELCAGDLNRPCVCEND